MFSRWKDNTTLAKLVIVLSAIFTVSLGLCGVNSAIVSSSRGNQEFFVVTVFLEFAGMLLSFFGLVIIGAYTFLRAIYRIFSHQD